MSIVRPLPDRLAAAAVGTLLCLLLLAACGGGGGAGGEAAPNPCAGVSCGDMVRIPASGETTTFVMGTPKEEIWSFGDARPHKVTLSTFFIDRYEVTVADYRPCVEALACTEPRTGGDCNWDVEGRDDHPVNCVTWYDANAYCEWRGKRLPTEAEWEGAARGESGRHFPWGDSCPASWGFDCTGGEWGPGAARANCEDCNDGYATTAPVGSFPLGATPDGVMDLAGNVCEWVWDCEGSYPAEAQTDPRGPQSAEERMHRGGGWSNFSYDLHAACRHSTGPEYAYERFGFRCAR